MKYCKYSLPTIGFSRRQSLTSRVAAGLLPRGCAKKDYEHDVDFLKETKSSEMNIATTIIKQSS